MKNLVWVVFALLTMSIVVPEIRCNSHDEDVVTGEDVKNSIGRLSGVMNEDGTLCLPQAGLTDEGVVFSFQPYEIDCFAAGCFHILVPYDKVKPYLNKQVGEMLMI